VTAITNKIRTYSLALLAVLGAMALAIAGCGGDSSSSGGGAYGSKGGSASGGGENKPASSEPIPGAESGAGIVSLGNVQKLGMVLVDSSGMTLYNFHKDKGTASSCYGACASAWPPLLTDGEPQVGNGAAAAKLGTTERKDGTTQVTYAGHPLYTFTSDRKPGEANGNDVSAFGGEWYALQGSGEEPED
jgi:predicted lipoprotein with Yx(FWY)xxD motif